MCDVHLINSRLVHSGMMIMLVNGLHLTDTGPKQGSNSSKKTSPQNTVMQQQDLKDKAGSKRDGDGGVYRGSKTPVPALSASLVIANEQEAASCGSEPHAKEEKFHPAKDLSCGL